MKNFVKKYVGDKAFYKTVLAIALPIMLQNGITNFVSLLDNIMVGQVGTEQMSGVAIVNQLIFVFNLMVFGTVAAGGIFTSQYHGKGNVDGVRQTFRFKLIAGTVILAVAVLIFALFGKQLIGLYLNDGSQEGDLELTLSYGVDYIWIMLIGLVPYTFSQAFAGTLRETEETLLPMIAGLAAVVVNCVGNYVLIFGKFGAPVMGVKGAAIATVSSRFVELAVLIVYTLAKSDKYPFIKGTLKHLFSIDKQLVRDILKKGSPLILNEGLWAIGVSALAQCYSQRGLAVVAGYNISSTIVNVFNITYMALGNAVGIILGKMLGAGKFDEAVDTDRKLIAFSVSVGVIMAVLLFSTSHLFPQIYNTTEEAKTVACDILRVAAVLMPVQSFLHSCYFTIRSGGKTLITFVYDCGFVLLVNFPIALIIAKCTSLPILPMYAIVNGVDVVKASLGFILLKKKIWLNQIV